ncbi:MAG: caspase family protein [Rubrivivax sp.]|nr:caspase family protein [Rubrivivax sp.]
MRNRIIALLLSIFAAGTASAEWRAVLVGVSNYPTLPAGVQRTVGARNDVLLFRDVLRQRGFKPEHIQVLADGVTGAQAPTRANILRALDDLAQSSEPGDFVFVHFAGHGSLEPASSVGEGATPILLPIDIGRWDGGVGAVENAIRRDDLRLRIDRIADRGAFVWGVFDACHVAAVVRQPVSPRPRRRFVEPEVLGIPLGAIELSEATPEEAGDGHGALRGIGGLRDQGRPAERRSGGTVFFYAAQAGESAIEMNLPAGASSPRSHGLFSYTVAQALQHARPMSYRQLGQAVLAGYGVVPAAYSTPVFAGNSLDHLVLGQARVPVRQWPLRTANDLRVDAGLLSGLTPGAVLAVLPGPTAADSDVVGHLRVVGADIGHATLEPVAHAGELPPKRQALSADQYLRLVHRPSRFALRVAYTPDGCTGDCPLTAAVRRLRSDGMEHLDLRWAEAPEGADILIRHRARRAELVSPAGLVVGVVGTIESVRPDPAGGDAVRALIQRLAHTLAGRLRAFARGRNLLSLAARHATDTASPAAGLATSLRRTARAGVVDAPRSREQIMRAHPGDTLSLLVENQGPDALDVTVLYLDAGFGISVLFPGDSGESNRLAPGTRRRIEDIELQSPPEGLERLLVIGRRATPGAERADFSFLKQEAPSHQAQAPDSELAVFADAAFADYRRRGLAHPAVPQGDIAMHLFTLDVRPPRPSLRRTPNPGQAGSRR